MDPARPPPLSGGGEQSIPDSDSEIGKYPNPEFGMGFGIPNSEFPPSPGGGVPGVGNPNSEFGNLAHMATSLFRM